MDVLVWLGSAIVGFVLLAAMFSARQEEMSNEASETVDVEQLNGRYIFSSGTYLATLIRQSGNIYRELGVFERPDDAMNEVVKSLRRAKIPFVRAAFQSKEQCTMFRSVPNARGRAEGKKLKGAIIQKIQDDTSAVQAKEFFDIGAGLHATINYMTPLGADFILHCGECGVVISSVPASEDEHVICPECSAEFETLKEAKVATHSMAEVEAIKRGWTLVRE